MQIALADKSATIRSALVLLIEMETDLRVAGEAADGCRLLDIIADTQPELIMVDWDLPGIELLTGSSGEAGVLVKQRADGRKNRVIVLGNDPRARDRALASIADYFVCKGDSPVRLLEAINAAAFAAGDENESVKGGDDTLGSHHSCQKKRQR